MKEIKLSQSKNGEGSIGRFRNENKARNVFLGQYRKKLAIKMKPDYLECSGLF